MERIVSKRRARTLQRRGEEVWREAGQWVWDWKRLLPFNKLSDSAKQHAIEHYGSHNDQWWSDSVIEQAKEEAAELGFDIDHVYWSGFSSQGDGASWVGKVDLRTWCMRRIEEDPAYYMWAGLAANGDMDSVARIETRGHYSHDGTMILNSNIDFVFGDRPFDTEDFPMLCGLDSEEIFESLGGVDALYDLGKAVLESARDYAREIYERLEEEYNYQWSEECFRETAEANEWMFDEDGELE